LNEAFWQGHKRNIQSQLIFFNILGTLKEENQYIKVSPFGKKTCLAIRSKMSMVFNLLPKQKLKKCQWYLELLGPATYINTTSKGEIHIFQ
jgi:hypothetical protein